MNLSSIDYQRNAAWLQLSALAVSLTANLRHVALDDEMARASTKTCGSGYCRPRRLIRHARSRILKIPPGWAWAADPTNAWNRLHALHPA